MIGVAQNIQSETFKETDDRQNRFRATLTSQPLQNSTLAPRALFEDWKSTVARRVNDIKSPDALQELQAYVTSETQQTLYRIAAANISRGLRKEENIDPLGTIDTYKAKMKDAIRLKLDQLKVNFENIDQGIGYASDCRDELISGIIPYRRWLDSDNNYHQERIEIDRQRARRTVAKQCSNIVKSEIYDWIDSAADAAAEQLKNELG